MVTTSYTIPALVHEDGTTPSDLVATLLGE